MSNGHSLLSPSGAPRWTRCTASPRFVASLKLSGEGSAYADEGTRAHETLAEALGLPNPYDVKFQSEEEEKHLPLAFEWVSQIRNYHPEAELFREIAVNPAPYVGTNHCKGTADIIIPVPFGPIYVADLKFGVGVVVDAIDNMQLMLYGLGALAEFERKHGYVFTELVLTIIQPRAYHPAGPVREWRVPYTEAMQWAKDLGAKAAEALGPRPVFRPGEDACRFCPAAGVCRHLAEYSLSRVRKIFDDIVDYEAEYKDVNCLTNVELGHILDNSPLIRRFLDEAYNHALQYETRGGFIPGWGLKEKQSNRMWDEDEEMLEFYFGDEIYQTKRALISPAAAEKKFGKKLITKFVKREARGYALTQVDAKKQATIEETSVFSEVDDDGNEDQG